MGLLARYAHGESRNRLREADLVYRTQEPGAHDAMFTPDPRLIAEYAPTKRRHR